ncbi:putative protein serine/threonine kinase [Tieghemostelium lacteum]|uniref:Uncharacterized protein n=1 Tax=Tieghemostelium lacteum TaxID=361077 RepID=A0A151ZJ22_TIELA|nr:putative protein serine/threonine kinase [Tieghemostelium lacteum]|eukprot:KYQ93905.1 putative protein serine/threonine kinase [Tieghemostelium lacteum]
MNKGLLNQSGAKLDFSTFDEVVLAVVGYFDLDLGFVDSVVESVDLDVGFCAVNRFSMRGSHKNMNGEDSVVLTE